ncbi:MAG: hypothetical protein KW788_01355 [Candidatus Doudnabacteria bacterium]|nr:hypothetical protein [Candidatus Doudnabacteria bacterium]
MNVHQHKIISALIVTTITFLGLESLAVIIGLNQLSAFVTTAVYLFLFHVFWVAFVFDLHLKHTQAVSVTSARYAALVRSAIIHRFQHFFHWPYVRHFLNYFILPSVLFWAAVILLYLNPFASELKQIIAIFSTLTFAAYYWHMKEHLSANLEAHHKWLRLLGTTKLFAVYFAFAAILGFSWYYGLGKHIVFYYVLAAAFFLIHQALFSYGYHRSSLLIVNFVAAVIMGFVGTWVYSNWTYQYFTGALILLAMYNTVWGFIHHSLDRTFTTKVALEYLVMGILVVSIIFATHNFGTRII